MNKTIKLLFVLIMFSTLAICQDFPLLHYTVENGLPSNKVYDIYRDSKGYLWMCTDKGVARYDGKVFKTYTTDNGLPDNDIFFSTEDRSGRLWFASYNGKLCFYKDGVFHTEKNTPFLKLPFKTSFIKHIFIEYDSSITISFNDQSEFINICKDQVSIHYSPKISEYCKFIDYIKKTPTGFEIDQIERVITMDKNGNYVKSIPLIQIKKSISSQGSIYLISDSFIHSSNYKVIASIAKYNFSRNNSLLRVYRNTIHIYYATSSGLIIDDSITILNNLSITSVTQDVSDNYWIGTLSDGIYCKYHLNATLLKNAYSGKVKYTTVKQNHLFYATSNNDLFLLKGTQNVCLFDFKKYSNSSAPFVHDGHYLINDQLTYFNFYGLKDLEISNILNNPINVKHHISKDSVKEVFAGSGNTVCIKYVRYVGVVDYSKLISGDSIQECAVYADIPATPDRIFGMSQYKDTFLCATIKEVYQYHLKSNKYIPQKQFENMQLKYFSLYKDRLVGYTHDNMLLVCTNIYGKMKIDTILFQNCIWEKFNNVDSANLLITTNNQYRLLTINDLQKNVKPTISVIENPNIPLHAESICSDSMNTYFFKDGTITTIETKTLFNKPASPRLFFESLTTKKRTVFIDSAFTVSYDEARNISLSFSTISFAGNTISYEYSFSKNDIDNWIDLNGEDINFSNQQYGTYFIKIRAKTRSSDYCLPVTFILTIEKPYWATWWFISAALLIIAGIISVAIKYRIRSVLRKQDIENKNELKYLRSEFKSLNALMNPHFIFNTLNNVQSLFNGNEKKAANEYLRIFADLIRQNMHNISKELISLQKEIDLVRNYLILEKLRFEDHLNFEINIDPEVDISGILVPPLLIQPLVENSLKHGILPKNEDPNGIISVNIFEREEVVYIEVKDNGIGIDTAKIKADQDHESYGIENIKKRIAQLNIIQDKTIGFEVRNLRDEKGDISGTIVIISIPY
ncbi:MAG: hypothetical protein JWQ38_1835 [Flavipsychrobacter sp.]|nr:hypothetical protein [Flavipsychrobacter sp.]